MKNNNILILLIATLGVGILCAIVASIAFAYYNGGFDELTKRDTNTILEEAIVEKQLPEMDTSALMEAVEEASGGANVDYVSLMSLMQKSQTCSSSLMILDASMATVQIDPSVLDNDQSIADIQVFLEEAKTNCDGLGDNDKLSNTYPDLIKQYTKAEKSIDEAIEYYQDYFKYKKSRYLDDGNEAYEEALEYLANAFEILQQTMTGATN